MEEGYCNERKIQERENEGKEENKKRSRRELRR